MKSKNNKNYWFLIMVLALALTLPGLTSSESIFAAADAQGEAGLAAEDHNSVS